MSKPLEKLPLYVSAASAIIVLLACIAVGATLYSMAAWVSSTIAIFYFIGHGVRFFLVTMVFPPDEEEYEVRFNAEDAEEADSDSTGEESYSNEEYNDEFYNEVEEELDDDVEKELEPVENAFLD